MTTNATITITTRDEFEVLMDLIRDGFDVSEYDPEDIAEAREELREAEYELAAARGWAHYGQLW